MIVFRKRLGKEVCSHVFSFGLMKLNQTLLITVLQESHHTFHPSAMTKKVSGLTRLTSLTLDMTDNCIGPGGCTALANMVKSLPQLTSIALDLSRTCMRDEGCTALAQELKGLTLLQSLTLCLRSNSIKIEGFGALLDMSVCFPKLHSLTLNLQGNWVGAAGCAMLEEKLDAHRTRLTSLTQLSIIYEGLKLGGLWG